MLLVFNDMKADMEANIKLSSAVTETELFFRGRKLNISLFFIS